MGVGAGGWRWLLPVEKGGPYTGPLALWKNSFHRLDVPVPYESAITMNRTAFFFFPFPVSLNKQS